MKVVVVHHRGGYGGGEVVMYFTISALSRVAEEVTVLSVEPIDWGIYEEIVEEPKPGNARNVSILKKKIGYFGIYQRLLPSFYLKNVEYDVVVNTHGDSLALFNIGSKPYVLYLHFPSLALLEYNPSLKYKLRSPREADLRGFLSSIGWRIYFEPYRLLNKFLFPRNLLKASVVIVNSRFTLGVTKRVCSELGVSVDSKLAVVNPPVPHFERYAKLRSAARVRKRVVTIGRFTPDKNYELVVELARRHRDIEFVIVGSVGKSKIYREYFSKIKSIAPPNLKLLPDASEREKLEVLASSSIYLHTMPGEHFGIAPAEAAVAGLTLIVHKRSGAWTDICFEGSYCYGYTEPRADEVSELLEQAIKDPRPVPVDRIEHLSPESFRRRMIDIVARLAR